MEGAGSYAVSYYTTKAVTTVVKTPKTDDVTLTVAKLTLGQEYTFTVQPCSDTKGKTPIGEADEVTLIIADWGWAAAPTDLVAALPDANEPVAKLTFTGSDKADGFEITDNKKTVLGTVQATEGETSYTADDLWLLTTGSHSLYVQPYRLAADGTKIYGTYSKAVKVTATYASMSWAAAPVIT